MTDQPIGYVTIIGAGWLDMETGQVLWDDAPPTDGPVVEGEYTVKPKNEVSILELIDLHQQESGVGHVANKR